MEKKHHCFTKKTVSTAILTIVLAVSFFPISSVFSVQPPVDVTTYYIGTTGQPRRLDPARAYDTTSGHVLMNVYEPLIFFNDKPVVTPNANHSTEYNYIGADLNSFAPVLCTEVPTFANGRISPDGKVWVFTINFSAVFQPWLDHLSVLHPADPVTREDVVYSFQRMLVQDMIGAPSWMFCLPGTGYMFYDALDTDGDTNTIDTNEAYVAKLIQEFVYTGPGPNDVTFNFTAAWPEYAMKQIFAQTCGGIGNKASCIEHGCWDGLWTAGWSTNYRRKPSNSCGPLDRYYNGFSKYTAGVYYNWPTSPGDVPAAIGSGPYKFTSWDKAQKVWRIDRWVGYWRDPAFAGAGDKAGNFLTTVIWKGVDVWPTRKMLFLVGEFDECEVPRANMFDLLDSPSDMYDPIDGIDLYYGYPLLSNDVAAFVLNCSSTTPYHSKVGGVTYDDFFYNEHMRRAFSYALNFTQYLAEAWWGEAIQQQSWWVDGLNPGMGYKNTALTPKNLDYATMEAELKLAEFDGNKVWDTGFETYLIYNIGNEQRRIACNMIQEAFASLGAKFKCNVIGIDWPVFLDYKEESFLPMFFVGWQADFADADNFARPYMHTYGDFSYFQSYSDPHVDDLIDTGIVTPDGLARADIYKELQQIYYDDALGIPLMQAAGRRWCRDWVRGWYLNQLYPCFYYYDLYKQPTGAVQNVDVLVTSIQPATPQYPFVYLYRGEMRAGGELADMTFTIGVARQDVSGGWVHVVVALKVTNTSNQFYYPNSTILLLAPLGAAQVPLTWSGSDPGPISPGDWTVSAEAYSISSGAVDVDFSNNKVTDGVVCCTHSVQGIKEDLHTDGVVDVYDALQLSGSFGHTGPPGWIPEDLMADGVIDMFDALMVSRMWNWQAANPAFSPRPVTWTLAVSTARANYTVYVYSDYIVYSQYSFNRILRQLSFNVTSSIDAFCNVSIPRELMSGNFTVYLDDVPTTSSTMSNVTYHVIYFDSTGLSHKVRITSDYADEIPGDLNHDDTVDILDAIILANAFMTHPGDPNWNPEADINVDGTVDVLDAIILSNHFLEHYP